MGGAGAGSLSGLYARAALAELELEGLGYSPRMIRAAVRFAVRSAVGRAAELPPDMRERAARELLEVRLRECPRYLDRMVAAASKPAPGRVR